MCKRVVLIAGVVVFLVAAIAAGQGLETYRLPQIANGTGIQTTFILFNNSDESAFVLINLTDTSGAPWDLTITGLPAGSVKQLTLAAGQTRFLKTSGTGTVKVGAATIQSLAPIGVSAIFSIHNGATLLTEAGIGASQEVTEAQIAVDTSSGFNTGVAILNTSFSPNKIDFQPFTTAGATQGSAASRTIPANGQLAIFANELFPSLTNFKGKLRIKGQGNFCVLALRQQSSTAKLTTLPAFASNSDATTFTLPQIANGTGIKTRFVLYNLGASAGTAVLKLTDDNGQPLQVKLSNNQTNSQFNLALPANGSLFLDTDGAGTVKAGAATIESTVPIGVSAIFSILNGSTLVTEAGVGDSPVFYEMTLPVDLTSGFNTGVALFNPGTEASDVTFGLLDGQTGTKVAEVDYAIAPQSMLSLRHLAKFVTELAPGASLTQGQLAITASNGVSAISLRQGPGTLTTLPVVEGINSNGGGGGEPPTQPNRLLEVEQSNVTITSNKTMDQALPDGFVISGTVTIPDGYFFQSASAKSSGGTYYGGSVDFINSTYRIVVPIGTYELAFCAVGTAGGTSAGPVPQQDLSGSYSIEKKVAGVFVNADKTQNATITAPVVSAVSGALTGYNKFPAGANVNLSFAGTSASGFAPVADDGTYATELPVGTYTVSAFFTTGIDTDQDGYIDDTVSSNGIYNVGSLTVGASPMTNQNFSVPDLVTLTGKVTQPQTTNYTDGSAHALDTTVPVLTNFSGCLTGLTGYGAGFLDQTGNYIMYLVKNRSYKLSGRVPITSIGTDNEGTLWAPNNPGAQSFASTSAKNIALPAKPAEFTLSGTVTDSKGVPLSGAYVDVFNNTGLTGTPDASFSAGTKTDAQGHYSLKVLSGTSYIVTFAPPVATYSPFELVPNLRCSKTSSK